nr:hypothetical protein [Maliibacterium massiliense]
MKTLEPKATAMKENYIYCVVMRLPERQREETRRELDTLIDDMLEEAAPPSPVSKADMARVLKTLGDPMALARQYTGGKGYLIGPVWYNHYVRVLRIALCAVGIGIAVFAIVELLRAQFALEQVPAIIGQAIGKVLGGLISAFGCITLIFAAIERVYDASSKRRPVPPAWDPEDLAEAPVRKAIISRGGAIVGIVFSVLFLVLFNAAPHIFGIYTMQDGALHVIPLFNMEMLPRLLLLINISIGCSILRDILTLLEGRYTIRLAVATLALNIAALTLSVLSLTYAGGAIWNPALTAEVQALVPAMNAPMIIGIAKQALVGIMIFAFVIDTVELWYKTLRYRVFPAA